MGTITSGLKSVMRGMGIAQPLRRWVLSNLSDASEGAFLTLSPDLLVALVRAFDTQTVFDGRAYYEFGLYRGFSIWFAEQISRNRTPKDFQLYGFDSFAGLPETKVDSDFYRTGAYSAGEQFVRSNLTKYGANWDRIKLFKGFYSEPHFAKLRSTERFLPVSIAVIDVDIYESCVLVLDFLRPYLVAGSILILDDYNDMNRSDDHGERKALREFEARTRMTHEHLFELGRECAAVRVTRAPDPST